MDRGGCSWYSANYNYPRGDMVRNQKKLLVAWIKKVGNKQRIFLYFFSFPALSKIKKIQYSITDFQFASVLNGLDLNT